MPDIIFVEGSKIGEFDYGVFSGHASRYERKSSRWCPYRQEVLPAVPEHWSITLSGINGAWRTYKLPLKRGRTLTSAIKECCGMAGSPDSITPDSQGYFGSIVSLL